MRLQTVMPNIRTKPSTPHKLCLSASPKVRRFQEDELRSMRFFQGLLGRHLFEINNRYAGPSKGQGTKVKAAQEAALVSGLCRYFGMKDDYLTRTEGPYGNFYETIVTKLHEMIPDCFLKVEPLLPLRSSVRADTV